MPAERHFALIVMLGLSLAACSTRARIEMSGTSTPRVVGEAVTTIYTGTVEVPGCKGYFTGNSPSEATPLYVSCAGGRQGRGTAVLQDGFFISGAVRWSDGGAATFRRIQPEPGSPQTPFLDQLFRPITAPFGG